ncbi:sodium/hydrogen exchanger 6 [Tanacetum coccineum]
MLLLIMDKLETIREWKALRRIDMRHNLMTKTRCDLWHNLAAHKVVVASNPWCLMGDFNVAHNLEDKAEGSCDLWHNLAAHKVVVASNPWCLMGDFNVAHNLEDKAEGSSCVDEIEVSDVNKSGLHITWNQKPKGNHGLLKKIDRIMANLDLYDTFVVACALFQPYRISDHSSAILKLPMVSKFKPKAFKFLNVLIHNDKFKDVVADSWSMHVEGYNKFCVVKKLKALKKPLRKLLYDQGNLHDRVKRLRFELDEVQKALDKDPSNPMLREEEDLYLHSFNEALLAEERFLKQKAKVNWLRVGDTNSAYFHKVGKSHVARSRIDLVADSNGIMVKGDAVPTAFIYHYINFLGQVGVVNDLDSHNLFLNKLSIDTAEYMVRDISDSEIKGVIFSMGDDKSPGPDGFSAAFFKSAWDIVGCDITNAFREFFENGKLLKEVNHTTIALIPKVTSPIRINDYRPISLCNVVFKCISKIISNRIKDSLLDMVSLNQSSFIPGRRITDNALLTQELMHNYHLDRGPSRCAFKRKLCNYGKFVFHHCEELEILNLCFANDLFPFSHGDVNSAYVIMEALDEFKNVSDLVPSLLKNTTYFCNVLNHVKLAILNVLPFKEGNLLVKCHGVPLASPSSRKTTL